MRRLGAVSAGLLASALLLFNTAANREREFARLSTPRRFWEDLTVAAAGLAHGEWPGAPEPGAAKRLAAMRLTTERAIIAGALDAGIRPWQPFRTLPPPRSVARQSVTLRPGDDKGRALLLTLGYKLLAGVAPALGLWLGAFAMIPILFWTSWELARAGFPRAAGVFPLLVACCSYVVEVLSLPYSAVGFYTLAILALVPFAVYALLRRPTFAGLLARTLAAGLILALCALCRSGTLLALPGFALAFAVGLARAERRLAYPLGLLAGAALLVGPWLAVRPAEHRQPWMALWQGLGDFDASYGHSFYDPDAKEALRDAGVELRKTAGVEFENPENDRVFRSLFYESVAKDPLWYARILLKRVGATIVLAPLWPHGVSRGEAAAAPLAARDKAREVYYRLTRTADWFTLGKWRVELPMPLLIAPPLLLIALVLARRAPRETLLLLASLAIAALGLPVLITTASALEPQAFMIVYLLAAGLCLDALHARGLPAPSVNAPGRAACLLLVMLATPPLGASTAPSPDSVLALKLGADRTLADWNQELAYFKALAAASDRVSLEEVGKSTEGRPFLIVTITSAANHAHLEEIRTANLRLADPRGLSGADAERLIANGKTIVALNHGIHPTEVAASQTAMETAYALASADDPETREILDETVILMIPSANPDGMQQVAEWYRKTLGTPFEGEDPPFLYQRFTGHDLNRDWYMFTQAESRLTVAHLYDQWHPQIVHDLHQMGAKGARIFVPPYLDPLDPNVDPVLGAATTALGTQVATRLLGEGKTGVAFHAIYDAWSPSRAYPFTHGGIRLLSECASAKLAMPVDTPFDELRPGLGYDPRQVSWNFPKPWQGGHWRLRDIMDYQGSATRAILEHAATNRVFWLRNFYEVSQRACARQQPYAFVIPKEQRDSLAAAKLFDVLTTGGVELRRAVSAFEAAGRRFEAGAQVVLMQQPASAFAKTLLEPQQYPEIRPHPLAPPQRPYDVTAHTLPLLLGVTVVRVDQPLAADLAPAARPLLQAGHIDGRGPSFALRHDNAALFALGRLLGARVPVRWATAPFRDRGREFPAGTLLVPGAARRALEPFARELGLSATSLAAAPPALVLRRPRVGLYQSFVPEADEGWTRYVFEHDAQVAYETLHDRDIRDAWRLARFDVIVLPSQTPKQIVEGQRPGTLPEEFTGGIGSGGVASLKAFVERGGTLIALNRAARLPIEAFGLPIRDALPRRDEDDDSAGVTAPGSILRVSVVGAHPLTHGLEATSSVWFESSPAFETSEANVVFKYAEPGPLLSGYLVGGEKLQGKAALVELPLGKGRVVLFGFRPQYRAQSWASYVPLLNALYLSAAR